MKNLIIFICFFPLHVFAQKPTLVIEGSSPNLYAIHTTAPKESFYSIGRLYNISPKEIAPYNKLTLENGLAIGQVIRIPLNTNNFSQVTTAGKDEALMPLYHVVKENETLAQVSKAHNMLPVATLKKWNKLSSDVLSPGSKLLVGYLKVNKTLSDFVNGKNYEPATTPADIVPHALDKPEEHVNTIPAAEIEVAQQPVPKPAEPTVIVAAKANETVKVITPAQPVNTGGFFETSFNEQMKNKTIVTEAGQGNIFKSISGWDDQKFYCLYNNAPAGNIVKITVNERSIYAKVLDSLPDMKQTKSLVVSMSNAAAAALGIENESYNCVVAH